jgi:hypothetical protein
LKLIKEISKMTPKTVDLTTLVGSIKGMDIKALTNAIIDSRKDDEVREKQIKMAVKNIKKT